MTVTRDTQLCHCGPPTSVGELFDTAAANLAAHGNGGDSPCLARWMAGIVVNNAMLVRAMMDIPDLEALLPEIEARLTSLEAAAIMEASYQLAMAPNADEPN